MNTPARSSFPTVVAIVGAFLVFAILLNLKYGGSDSKSAIAAVQRPSLAEHRAEETALLSEASIIDASSGKARLPIDRAKQLVISKYSK